MPTPPSKSEIGLQEMLDKRDIQTLMYCVRVAEASGHWREAGTRSPERLSCKLAEMLRELDRERRPTAA